MYNEDQLLPLSGLQHLAFCPRQCALIHLEQCWSENELTAAGRVMHERVHSGRPKLEATFGRSAGLRSVHYGSD